MPYEVKSDNGASFRQTWEEELDKLGVSVLHWSKYNSQSMDLVERSVRTLKEILSRTTTLVSYSFKSTYTSSIVKKKVRQAQPQRVSWEEGL